MPRAARQSVERPPLGAPGTAAGPGPHPPGQRLRPVLGAVARPLAAGAAGRRRHRHRRRAALRLAGCQHEPLGPGQAAHPRDRRQQPAAGGRAGSRRLLGPRLRRGRAAAGRAPRRADPAGPGQPRRSARTAGDHPLRRRPEDRPAARLAAAGLQRRRRRPRARAHRPDLDRPPAGRALRRPRGGADRRPHRLHAGGRRRSRSDRRAERHHDRARPARLPAAPDRSAGARVADPRRGRARNGLRRGSRTAADRRRALRRHLRRPRVAAVREGRRADQPSDHDLRASSARWSASSSRSARCS